MFDPGLCEFEALDDVLDRLTDVDPMFFTDGQVHRTLMELLAQQARLAAVTMRFAESWNVRRTWAENGSKSPEARLGRDAKVRRATAARLLRRAKALASMPNTARALRNGEITVDHADLLIHANARSRWRCTRFAADEETLVGYCKLMSLFDAERTIRYWINRVDAEGADDGPEPTYRDREATSGRGIGGEVHLRAILDPVGGGEFLEALDRIEHDLYVDDKHTGDERTETQRRADALVEMARRAMGAPPDARLPRPLLSVVIGDMSFRWLCELADGTVITPRSLVPYLADAEIETALFDGPFYGVGMSGRRSFTGVVRRLIELRDRHCQHPSGCDVPMSRCDVDHITPHRHDGITGQENGRLQCHAHNRDSTLHHRGPADITIHGDDPIVLATRRRIDDLTRRTSAR